MKSTDAVGITFANLVLARGIYNNVVNLTLGAYQFEPDADGAKIEPDPVVTCRLRMDTGCVLQMRDALNDLLKSIEDAKANELHPAMNGGTTIDTKPN